MSAVAMLSERRQTRRSDKPRTPKDPGLLKALSIIARDLRGPIANLSVLVELMDAYAKVQSYDRMARSAHRAHGVVDALSDLLDGFLERARQTGDPLAFNPGLVDLPDLLRRVAELNEPVAAARGVAIRLDGLDALVVKGDAKLLGEALDDIFANAAKNSRPGSVVTCSIHLMGRDAIVGVHDSGSNATERDLKRALKPFASVVRKRGGAVTSFGVELWIARLILERHGGRLSVTADPRGGTRLGLQLPASLI